MSDNLVEQENDFVYTDKLTGREFHFLAVWDLP